MPFDMIPREDQVLTPEVAFTIAVEHLTRQGLASFCYYECSDGTMCAVGALMTHKERIASFNRPIATLMEEGMLPERLRESYSVLYTLQRFHDAAVRVRQTLSEGALDYIHAHRREAQDALRGLKSAGMPEDGIALLETLIP